MIDRCLCYTDLLLIIVGTPTLAAIIHGKGNKYSEVRLSVGQPLVYFYGVPLSTINMAEANTLGQTLETIYIDCGRMKYYNIY
jgi:hypothetical protein